ncbi:MAG: hypothetical protein HAW60_04665 [Bdellovibrionales bacterium]|nr:hypothetical protein [Bdellovibrionales bacterium]
MNKFTSLVLFCFLVVSCVSVSTIKTINKPTLKNIFPEIFEFLLTNDGDDHYYKVEVIPKALHFECTMRNDYPHYWCGIEAKIKYPSPKLPKVVDFNFMSSKPKYYVDNYKKLINKLKKSKEKLYLLSRYFAFISNSFSEPIIVGQLHGMHNKNICLNWFDDFQDCPKTAKHFNPWKKQK